MPGPAPRGLRLQISSDIPAAARNSSRTAPPTRTRATSSVESEMLVVAPASEISRLDWLTNAEDDARSEADSLAVKTAQATPTEDVEARVGDSNPVKAIEDALRTLAAVEMLVVAHPDDQAG